jgi:hypothetical protein
MNRLHEGLDYLLYRIYIWGGIAAMILFFALVITADIMEWVDISDKGLLALIFAPVTLWLLGVLLYWWWVFLFKGDQELKESMRNPPQGTPPISALKSWTKLHSAMSIYGGDLDETLRTSRAARQPVTIWYGMQNLLVLWIVGNFWVWLLFEDSLPSDYLTRVMAPGVVVIAVLLFVATPLLLGRSMKGGETAYLAPLGLGLVDSYSAAPYLSGLLSIGRAMSGDIIVVEGSRRGRLVHIETAKKHCYTCVLVQMPPFEIHSQAGKLVAGPDAPPAVARALKGLRKAKRWRGIKVTGGLDGICVERESPGQNMWLYDLWLIERFLEKAGKGGA